MNTSFKKILAVLLSVLMVTALCAGSVFTAFAADPDELSRKIGEARSYYEYILEDCPDAAAALLIAVDAAERVSANEAAMPEDIDNAFQTLALAMDVAAFEWWRTDYIRIADNYAEPGDSEACAALIAEAKTLLADMTYDASVDFYNNRSRLNSVVGELNDALRIQREADYAAAGNWVQVAVAPDGLEDGSLYLDFAVLETAWTEIRTNQNLYDLIPANNAGRVGYEYLKATYPEEWAAACAAIVEQNGLDPETYNAEYFADEAYGGTYRYDAEDLFRAALADLGVDVSWSNLQALGAEYVKTAYAAEYAEARNQAEAWVQSRIAQLKDLDWYINTVDYRGIKAMDGGSQVQLDYESLEIRDTLSEAGADWAEVRIVESADGLANGDYYMLKEALTGVLRAFYGNYDPGTGAFYGPTDEQIAQMAESYSVSVNKNASDTSLFRYKITQTSLYGEGPSTGYLPLRQMQYGEESGIITAAFLDENVVLYHPAHSFGEWAPDADNDGQHIRTCSVCGETETEAHAWGWVTDTEPTATEAGVQHEECAVCGAKRNEGTPIAATGDDTPDDTSGSGSSSAGRGPCVWCGEVHNGGFFDTLIFIVHAYMAYFRALAALFGVSV